MRFKNVVLCLAAITLMMAAAIAQTVTGTLSGTVRDSSGAVVPNVEITAKNEDTGLTRTSLTNEEGYYLMSFLPLGSYTVTVAQPGFKTIIKSSVTIELNKNTVSDFSLEVSAQSEVVQVTGETPQIQTTTGELKHSLGAQAIQDTPLPGRNFMSLVEQIPGFQNASWIGSSNNPTNSTGSYAVFNGQGSRSATFQVDGVNNDDSSENQNRQNVNVSTIKELQVLTNAFSAEFGRAGGAVVLVQTKSGTNRFHGEAYDYIQNNIFNANGYFSNRAGNNSLTGQPLSPRQIVRRNNWGWNVGGPAFKDKLFFFTSGERVENKTSSTISRFTWLPGETPRACAPGEVAAPGGPYCLDPAQHPNLQKDIDFMRSIMRLWDTPELKGKQPNDPTNCADLIASGRPNRCVTIAGIGNVYPDSDYTGRLDWKATEKDNVTLRYQYSRQIRQSGRIIFGDNYGWNNNRQYNLGLTLTHVFNPRQVGEFRYGLGNRATLQDVADGNDIPTVRYSGTLIASGGGTIIGTSTNVPINRRQIDHQFVYNQTIVFNRHTLRAGIDQRNQLLDDLTGDRARGYWTFSTLDSTASIRAKTGWTGFENFLRGYVTGYQKGFGNPMAENRFGETNVYVQDDYKIRHNLTLNLGLRYEYVRAPKEKENRFSYGFGDDKDNIQPRFGFAWTPTAESGFLRKLIGSQPGGFVIRGGYGIYHSRLFQSIFSQNQLSIRTQPPNGYAQAFDGLCRNEIADPSCGFVFTPATVARSAAFTANGVKDIGGRLGSSLLMPDPNLQMPYVQQWNLTMERRLPGDLALQIGYNANRGIGLPFLDSENDALYPFTSPSLLADIGGGVFKPVVFDRACTDFSDPICVVKAADGSITVNSSGTLRAFSALTSTTATLAQKGIVVDNGVPHGYISLGTLRSNERRPNATMSRNVHLQNFTWTYYHAMVVKVQKRFSRDLNFSVNWTWSKAIDTGSEATYTGVDTNAPASRNGNAAASLRGLSGYDARHRITLSYSYYLPFFRDQRGLFGRILGGWNLSGLTVIQSGNPFSVTLGYDMNADGLSGDRPRLAQLGLLYNSVDNGRSIPGGAVIDTFSQTQLPGSAFIPAQAGTIASTDRLFLPGKPLEGTVGRNTFISHGMHYWDTAFFKTVKIHESIKLTLKMELYNLFNRVNFDTPSARTIFSSTPLGRITAQRNPANYVNAGRDNGSRMGQISLRLEF